MNIVLGIVGAIVGGFLWGVISGQDVLISFNFGSLIIAIIGGLLVTFVVGLVTGRRA